MLLKEEIGFCKRCMKMDIYLRHIYNIKINHLLYKIDMKSSLKKQIILKKRCEKNSMTYLENKLCMNKA